MNKKVKGSSVEVARATISHVRISHRKAKLIADLIRGKQVETALRVLRFQGKKGAEIVEKVLQSAVFNAREQKSADVDRLFVTGAQVGMGRTIKRFMPRAQGRASPIRKRSSHITVVLSERA